MKPSLSASLFLDNAIICLHLIFLAAIFILTGIGPVHDAISWQGVYHYFYSNLEKGILPYWNPYSQTGTPFYAYYQAFGLLEPSNLFFALIQKITGCTTLMTYMLHYLFCYLTFILGAYYAIRLIAAKEKTTLLFSLVLFFATLPIFYRQNGAMLPFFLVPFITYFALLFFKEAKFSRKGRYLFIAAVLFGISLNVYIPSGMIFYCLLFIIIGISLGIFNIQEALRFSKSKEGVFWISASFATLILLSAPTLVLYHELLTNNEIFPTVRFLQKNGNNLVRCYASNFKINFLDPQFTNNLKVSITSGNLLGLLLEPIQRYMGGISSSEIRLFIGIVPLGCVLLAVVKFFKDKHVQLFSLLALFILLLMCNFKNQVIAEPGLLQNAIASIFPALKGMEVLQNLGTLFLFCLVIIGAIGFERAAFGGNARTILTAILFINLFIFEVFNMNMFSDNYYSTLKQEGILRAKRETSFANYREPFSLPKEGYSFNAFFGHEIYHNKKVAFPYAMKFAHAPFFDHIYMTKYYYDYLVNVDYDKQAITSNITTPILNFFPMKDAVFAKDKYEAVRMINGGSARDLTRRIFIEENEEAHAYIQQPSYLFDPDNYLRLSQNEASNFKGEDIAFKITDHNVNKLQVAIDAPEDGYFYFGDGYSRHWRAFVDGQKTNIEKTNINFKSVYVPKGKHDVLFVYDPIVFRYSLYAYFAGLFMATLILVGYLALGVNKT